MQKNIPAKLLLILSCIFISACCTPPHPQKNDQVNKEEYKSALNNLNTMWHNLMMDSSLDIIRDKVSMKGATDTTFEMLTNQAIPNEEEKLAIQKWVWKWDYCARGHETILKRFNAPEPIIIINKIYNDKALFLITDLYMGSINYGDYNKKRKALYSERASKMSEMGRLDRQLAEQMAIELRKVRAQEDAADAAWFNAITAPARNPNPVYVPPPIR